MGSQGVQRYGMKKNNDFKAYNCKIQAAFCFVFVYFSIRTIKFAFS